MAKPESFPSAKTTFTSRRIAAMSVFTALAIVGSFIPIPGPIPSLAFDSCAGFFVALYFGALEGAFVCGVGHLATAAVHGFPYGWLHIPIALGMALAGASIDLFVKLNKKWGFIPGVTAAVAINTLIVFPLSPWLGGWLAAVLLVPPLIFAASVNGVVAVLAYVATKG